MTLRSRSAICREVLEEPADLVLNIPLDLDEQTPADKKSFDRVTVEIFDADLLVPSTLHDTCYAHGVVAVALVDLQLQSRLRVPSVDADDRQPILFSSVHSHVDVAPVSSPTRATCGACDLINAAMVSGSDATTPRARFFLFDRRCRSLSASAIRPVQRSVPLRLSMIVRPP